MEDKNLLRYSKQILLPEIDIEGQKKLNSSKIFIVGLGGLGSMVSEILVRSGIKSIFLCDDDTVELTNLHRQIQYREKDLGLRKVEVASRRLKEINNKTVIEQTNQKIDKELIYKFADGYDLIVDCTDNFLSRYLINEYCYQTKKVLISASVIGWKGQWLAIDFSKNTPCYECIFGFSKEEDLSCSESGVSPSVVGIIGSMQANEVIKSIIGLAEQDLVLNQFDGQTNRMAIMKVIKDPDCRICR